MLRLLCPASFDLFERLSLRFRDEGPQHENQQHAEGGIDIEGERVVEVPDEPGGLAKILTAVEKAGVNVEYMYGFTLNYEGRGVLAFRFDDPDRALEALKKNSINPVASVELFKRLHRG